MAKPSVSSGSAHNSLGSQYIFQILVITVIYISLSIVARSLNSLIWLVATVAGYMTVSQLIKTAAKKVTAKDKQKAVLLMAVSPVLVQAFYYYRLRKTQPTLAKTYNDIGWKVFIWEVVLFAALSGILLALTV